MPHSLVPLAVAVIHNDHLRLPDLLIIGVYLLAITLFGLRFRAKSVNTAEGKPDRSLKTYFLAGNTIPWWAIALSVVSAETSTLTIVSIPGVAFAGNFGFLQVVLGYLLGRVVVAALFLPRYFAGEMLTAYQLIDRRFGPFLHKVTAGLFLLTRAAAEGVRVFAVSIVVGIAIGTGDVLSIGIISALTLLYTFEGGLAAVIWTDVVQMAIYVGGTLVALLTLGHHVAGGWPAIVHTAGAADKFHLFNFALNLTQSYTFWAGVLGGTFLTMASHGTDQLMVQRLLAARNLRESQLALLSSGVVIFAQFAFFLLIGAGLWVFYGQRLGPHAAASFHSNDYIFPTFIVREMPVGIAGLLIAAILAAAMSNLSAALNSLSSTTVVDFYIRARPGASDRERTLIAKSSTVLWAFVLFAIAIYSVRVGGKGHVVEVGLSIASVAYGCLLGVFLLGTLTRYATEYGAAVGMFCGFALNLWLWQGTFPVHLGPLTIPKIAFTWFVLIGAAVTFAIGSLASFVFRARPRNELIASVMLAITLLTLSSRSKAQGSAVPLAAPQTPGAPSSRPALPGAKVGSSLQIEGTPDFTLVSQLITDALAQHKLPGAVVVIGHNGEIAFKHAYGNRKLANEPGLDNQPSPAEPMTEDTIFDMASLTKCIVTATAIGQLYEQGKLDFDTPLDHYLPAFNPSHDPIRAQVTLRLLLTHFSGEAPDVDLKDPWGRAAPDKAEGIRRALTTPLAGTPGAKMVYSDINFILLGALVEKLSGQRLDDYAREHIFQPLGMKDTRYLAFDQACGADTVGAAIVRYHETRACTPGTWSPFLRKNTAPTAHDDEGTAATNPDFNHLLRGTVHDPTTRRMGGVAGHAGVFSTAHDMSLFAQAFLDKLARNTGAFPLKQSTLQLLTTPEQPGHTPNQLAAANAAEQASLAAGEKSATGNPDLLAPNYPAIKGQVLRGFGWDIDSGYSKPRGRLFPIGSFGHTGFTGTSLWMDPASDTFVLLLANAIHPHPGAPISNFRGEIATAAAEALHLYVAVPGSSTSSNAQRRTSQLATEQIHSTTSGSGADSESETPPSVPALATTVRTLTGIDVLESTHFAVLNEAAKRHAGTLRLGLLTNQTGLDNQGRRTVDILNATRLREDGIELTTLFSPEHGIFGRQDTEHLNAETDTATGLHVTSLYGAHDADRRPSHDQLKDLDAVVIDLQDAGVRFYTYETVVGYFLEAAAHEKSAFSHDLEIIVLDRPNPIGGDQIGGPVSDPGTESYINYMPLPLRHGLTLGELARFINTAKQLGVHLTVVPLQNWHRNEYFEQTALPWVNPSPNLRSLTAATLYPATAFLELTNISVGRGTTSPFELFGAGTFPTTPTPGAPSSRPALPGAKVGSPSLASSWFNAAEVAAALNVRTIPGVRFEATSVPVAEDANHYPFHGQTIEAVRVILTDRDQLQTSELGLELLSVLHRLYPRQFQLEKAMRLVASRDTLDRLAHGDDPRTIAASWQAALNNFRAQRQASLLY
ncbi:MAG: sodium:solute symporter family transporter [Janthinobacterium lividum]